MEITISGQNRRLLKLVEQLAKELGLSISKTESIAEKREKMKTGRKSFTS